MAYRAGTLPFQGLCCCTCWQFRKSPRHWGYAHSHLPPDEWYEQYPIARTGHKQSPINIDCSKVANIGCKPLSISYEASDLKSVSNNGHSVTFLASGGHSVLLGGPLESKYTLEQFHFHWGKTSSAGGSEHMLDGNRFAAEMHLVHWNSEKYATFADSLGHSDGLCVLGVFIQADTIDNVHFKKVTEAIKHVPYKNNKYDIVDEFNPATLLPGDLSCYYYYDGSLTTPPLKECVRWVVFKNPIKLSEDQLNSFRNLHLGETPDSAHLCDNYRPVQDIYSRIVSSND